MKTFQTFLLVNCMLLITSCNNDDNSSQQGYFPTQIILTDDSNSVNDKTVNIEYNTDNTISKIEIQDNQGVKIKQYNYTNGKITSVSNSGFLSGPEVRTFVYNASGKLSSIIDDVSGTIETFPITYNSSTNTYTLTDGGDSNTVVLDASHNPIVYSNTFVASDLILTLDSNSSGVFKNVTPQIALQFDLGLFSGHLFYFFSQKQINHFQYGVQNFDVINTRDANDNITNVFFNFIGGGSELNITHQKRNLN
ncbi:conserved hypothetical protein [Flavobacterium sp. 9AF]|uniref:hypothetical protein n=1 Tax=Flavobacterium sp. 9AF TaxID=2653142 RepID=UPI0012F2562C|nr:hypothetical protein [Flavobacterium sp. 9AF]VXB70388.1 conserved hypothetical protein [Flavobacterium sp. 9AF]